jgi:hypothetical protein
MSPDPMMGGGITQESTHDELRHQQLELKNVLPLDIYLGMEYASIIKSSLVFGGGVSPRKIRQFYQSFWHTYNYVKGSVDAEKLNPDLINTIDMWFREMPGKYKNTRLLEFGVDMYLEFVKNMQEWGIGRLFEKGIDPPFMLEDSVDFDLLTEEMDEEVIINAPEG